MNQWSVSHKRPAEHWDLNITKMGLWEQFSQTHTEEVWGNVLSPGPTAPHLLLWTPFGGEALGRWKMLIFEAICHQEQMSAAGPCRL